ncbi:hypothetical protein [Brevibacillus massiliensis]|uniref:hypothetical protein n=1 Tax=Brevibacillus massiliensis TaxID=1118054 RepID=UPI0003149587|nr:hypothetical protein [Brevibacillus massiliensis]
MSEEMVKAIAEFRQYLASQGHNIDHLSDEDVYKVVTGFRVTAEMIGKALREIMRSRSLKAKSEEKRQRKIYFRKNKSQMKNWKKWKKKRRRME